MMPGEVFGFSFFVASVNFYLDNLMPMAAYAAKISALS